MNMDLIDADEYHKLHEQHEFVMEVLRLYAEYDDTSMMDFWRCDGEYAPITFFVNCNDLFYWACADAEPITRENLPELRKAFADIYAIDRVLTAYAPSLFACRVRKMRPQPPAYPKEERLKPLFDACGPERDRKECG